MVYSKLIPGTPLTVEEIEILERAEKMPIVFDEDCPEPTPAQMAALMEARRRKPYHGPVPDDILAERDAEKAAHVALSEKDLELTPVTLYLTRETLERAAALDKDAKALMSRLLTDALRVLDTRRRA